MVATRLRFRSARFSNPMEGFQQDRHVVALRELAERGVYLGTSSWKYEGWIGSIYSEQRYIYRGKFAKKRFEQNCLAEYAEQFPAVCLDAGYYRFPPVEYLRGLAEAVPQDFRFGLKVTDRITVKRFPNLPRFGKEGGKENPHFLDAKLFQSAFVRACEMGLGNKTGVMILEFSQFSIGDFARGRDFVEALDRFLSGLEPSIPLAVELRNDSWLEKPYFDMLASHGVAHCVNQWARMPAAAEQMAMPGAFDADFVVGRFLLRKGRDYQKAVESFSPYSKTQEVNPEAREAAAKMVLLGMEKARKGKPSFIFVNNRLEGNSPNTIAAILEKAVNI